MPLTFIAAQFDIRREGKKSWAIGTVIKLDLAGDIKRIKVHYPNTSFKHDEWIEVDSPRLAAPYSRVQRPQRKEKSDNGNQNRGPKQSKPSKSKEKKSSKKKSSGKGENGCILPNEISDDASIEHANKSHVVQTDDSSMADVFLQDSDEDDDEQPMPKKEYKTIALKRVALDNIEADGFLDEKIQEEDDELKDSEDEDEADQGKSRVVPITDENSSEACETRENTDKEKTASSGWTIPKKKTSPVKRSLIRSSTLPRDDAQSEFPADKSKTANRIPRKQATNSQGPQSMTSMLPKSSQFSSSPRKEDKRARNHVEASAVAFTGTGDSRIRFARHGNSPLQSNRYQVPLGREVLRSDTSRGEVNSDSRIHGQQHITRDQLQPNAYRPESREGHERNHPRFDRAPGDWEACSPNYRARRSYDDIPAVEGDRTRNNISGYHESPSRDRRYHDEAYPYRQKRGSYTGYDGQLPSHQTEPADTAINRRSYFNESNAPERDGRGSRGGYEEWRGHGLAVQSSTYNDDNYNRNIAGNAGEYCDRRYDRWNEYTSNEWEDDKGGRRWNRDSRDRWEGASWRHQDYSPDGRRYARAYEEYDDYSYSRRHDRSGRYDDRYDDSPRRKHRSRRSRDRSRDRDKRRSSSRSERRHRPADERSDRKSSHSNRDDGKEADFAAPSNPEADATVQTGGEHR